MRNLTLNEGVSLIHKEYSKFYTSKPEDKEFMDMMENKDWDSDNWANNYYDYCIIVIEELRKSINQGNLDIDLNIPDIEPVFIGYIYDITPITKLINTKPEETPKTVYLVFLDDSVFEMYGIYSSKSYYDTDTDTLILYGPKYAWVY